MSNAIIIDTETTGVNEGDEPVSVAFVPMLQGPLGECGLIWEKLFKPSKPIGLGAIATHNIIEDDLADADPWVTGKLPIDPEIQYFIGHNVDFDWRMVGSPNVKRICTLALARHVWPNIETHTLSACIYNIYPHKMARSMVRNAHSACADVLNTLRLFQTICCALQLNDWETVHARSEVARVPTHFTFGKYGPKDGKKGFAISEVRKLDRGYIGWCLRDCDIVTKDPYWIKALTQ